MPWLHQAKLFPCRSHQRALCQPRGSGFPGVVVVVVVVLVLVLVDVDVVDDVFFSFRYF